MQHKVLKMVKLCVSTAFGTKNDAVHHSIDRIRKAEENPSLFIKKSTGNAVDIVLFQDISEQNLDFQERVIANKKNMGNKKWSSRSWPNIS